MSLITCFLCVGFVVALVLALALDTRHIIRKMNEDKREIERLRDMLKDLGITVKEDK